MLFIIHDGQNKTTLIIFVVFNLIFPLFMLHLTIYINNNKLNIFLFCSILWYFSSSQLTSCLSVISCWSSCSCNSLCIWFIIRCRIMHSHISSILSIGSSHTSTVTSSFTSSGHFWIWYIWVSTKYFIIRSPFFMFI